jgi:hypothetical protein
MAAVLLSGFGKDDDTLQVRVLTSRLQSRIVEARFEAAEVKRSFKYLGSTVTSMDVRNNK